MSDSRALYDKMIEVIEAHQLGYCLPYPRCGYAPWVINTPVPGVADVQCTHVFQLNPLDPADLTRGTAETVEI